ncbi:MAG: response regulator, partial [Gemmata sp.]
PAAAPAPTPAPRGSTAQTARLNDPPNNRAPRGSAGQRPDPRTHAAPARPSAESRGLALVADDEPTVRQVGEMMLSQMGYEVLTASNGAEVLDLFTAHKDRVRVVLLDLMMPVMDGTEALAAIRGRCRSVPVILCSGYTSEAVPEELTRDAATGFLQKPFARNDLKLALAAIGA